MRTSVQTTLRKIIIVANGASQRNTVLLVSSQEVCACALAQKKHIMQIITNNNGT